MIDGCIFIFSSRRRHTRFDCDWSSDVCSSDLLVVRPGQTVKVTATGLAINDVAADSAWATLLGMGRSDAPYYLEGGRPDEAAPAYPLPACPDCGAAPKVIARPGRRSRR